MIGRALDRLTSKPPSMVETFGSLGGYRPKQHHYLQCVKDETECASLLNRITKVMIYTDGMLSSIEVNREEIDPQRSSCGSCDSARVWRFDVARPLIRSQPCSSVDPSNTRAQIYGN